MDLGDDRTFLGEERVRVCGCCRFELDVEGGVDYERFREDVLVVAVSEGFEWIEWGGLGGVCIGDLWWSVLVGARRWLI
jgi:hypothetical protein